jgi:hypothetical protein
MGQNKCNVAAWRLSKEYVLQGCERSVFQRECGAHRQADLSALLLRLESMVSRYQRIVLGLVSIIDTDCEIKITAW